MGWIIGQCDGFVEKSALHGNLVAARYLGNAYWNGNGVEKDERKAVAWWRKPAEQGYAKGRL